ncbi:MAG TPA: hypothetical protein VND43_03325 [Burkholderiales bacterium]|nr:hypothetical protein [Burkholderiales bacterium]
MGSCKSRNAKAVEKAYREDFVQDGAGGIRWDGEHDYVISCELSAQVGGVRAGEQSQMDIQPDDPRKKNYPCIRKQPWGGALWRHLILRPRATAHQLPSFTNISSNVRRLNKLTTGIPAVSALFISPP